MKFWYKGKMVDEIKQSNRTFDYWIKGKLVIQDEKTSNYITGTVTLSEVPIEGATVILFADNNVSELETQTTDSNGEYTFNVSRERTYHLTVTYESGGIQYNALSKWDISPVGVL